MGARRRAFPAVVVAGAIWALGACTQQVPLLSVAPSTDGEAPEPEPEDAGAWPDGSRGDAQPSRDLGSDVRCEEYRRRVSLDFQSPHVIISLDRSFSMFEQKFRGRSWWEAVRQGLTNYLRNHDGAIQFGYEEFPARAGTCDGTTSGCCGSRVLVQPYLHSHHEIERKLRCDSAADGCFMTAVHAPAGDALSRIRQFYEFSDAEERFVLLITDKSPSCPTDPAQCEDAGREAARMFSTRGTKTIVLPLGEEARASTCLETVAVAGQTRLQGATDFPWASDPGQVEAQLQRAMGVVVDRACRFSARIEPSRRDRLAITISFMPLPRDSSHKEGWDFDPPGSSEIQLYGSACTKIMDGAIEHSDVRAYTPCMQCGSQSNCQ
jgi:hypothetical protein